MRLRSQQVGLNAEGGGSPFRPGKRTAGRVAVFLGACGVWLAVTASLFAANVPAGFTETVVPGPGGGGAWSEAIGVTFSDAGRMFVWERAGRIWFKEPADAGFTQLLDISDEVANWGDHGCTGFALDPDFQVNGNIYLLYAVDRHHLLNFGTTNYNPNANAYTEASIGRVTRYTCNASNNFTSVNLGSRFILLGESKTNGIPNLSDTHGAGSLVFGQDHTLLVSCGDGASAWLVDTGGGVNGSFAVQGLSDGIIKAKENVGGYRSQLVDCLDGKILRLDPVTGNGVPSNPFYDATKPRSAKSRVWTVGTRNPFRMSLRPESGSHDPTDAKPGTLYIGNVGWDNWESLKVVTGPGQNLGWPLFEGLELTPTFIAGGTYNVDVSNLDATNALCGGYFSFRQLLKQDSTASADQPPFNNPCNAGQKISTNIPQFLHKRPALDWNHVTVTTRTGTYNGSGQATTANIGAGGSPVTGTQFTGNCAIGGTWYVATNVNAFPTQYQNRYFMADWGTGFMKTVTFTTNDQPVAVNDFATAAGAVVSIAAHPTDGSIYYVSYNYGDAGTVRKIAYTGNRTPVPVATSDKTFGPGPLTVQFNGSGSSDPDGQALTYAWNFGDGTAVSTAANPSHTFTPPNSNAAPYTVTLTVTDTGSLSANASLLIVANDTPPVVTINNPTNGALYSMVTNTTFNLAAAVTDAESGDAQLAYTWETILHHNSHNHLIASSTNHASSTVVEPIGCDGVNILYYRIVLTVTDPAGLKTTREVGVFPNCGSTDTPPTISDITNQSVSLGVATAALPFTIGDAQVAAANLQLSAGSSNLTLVPLNNIVFGGNGANRTVTVTPSAGINGTSLITVTVNDGPNNVSDTFLLTVTGSNSPPTISALADQSTGDGTPTAPNAFTIADVNTPAGNLALSGFAANTNLVPTANISFGGSGSNRTVTVTPAPGQLGSTLITVVVSDGQLSASNSYTLTVTVSAQPAGLVAAYGFNEGTGTTVTDASGHGIAGIINGTTWTTGGKYGNGLSFNGSSSYVDLGNPTSLQITGSMTWSAWVKAAANPPDDGQIVAKSDDSSGWQFKTSPDTGPHTFGFGVAGGVNAFAQRYSTTVRSLNVWYHVAGVYNSAAGTLDIYVNGVLDNGVLSGTIPAAQVNSSVNVNIGRRTGGFYFNGIIDELRIYNRSLSGTEVLADMNTPVGSMPSNTAPTITTITNQITTVNTPESGVAFTIGDAQTAASNLVLTATSANLTLVPSNNITFGGSGASRTVTITPASNQLGTATITLIVSDGSLSASNSFVLTVNPASLVVTENSASRSYGATNPVLAGSVTGLQAGDVITASFTTTAATNSPVGAYAIAVTLSDPGSKLGNYIVTTNNGTLTVTNAPLTVTENSASRIYGATNPVLSGSVVGLLAGDVITATFTTTAISNSPVGAYPIAFTLSDPGNKLGNYTVTTNNGTLTVTPVALLVKANNTNKVYRVLLTFTGKEFTLLSGTLLNGNTLTNVSLASSGAAKGAKVGTYPITASAAQGLGLTNYSITYSNGLLTVTPTNLTIAATSLSKTYGISLALPGTSFTNTDMEPGDTVTNVALESGGTNAAAAAGLYAITSTNALGVGLTNYDIEYASNTLTVAQAVLTATADDRSRAYGQPNPALTISFTGLVNGEGTNVLNSLPLASTTATTTTAPGTYPITLAGGLDDNYSFSLVAGTLSILPPGNISVTTVERLDADHFRLAGTGDANVNYQIQASTDLQSWQTLGTATADGAGAFEFVDALAGGFTARFYRVATP